MLHWSLLRQIRIIPKLPKPARQKIISKFFSHLPASSKNKLSHFLRSINSNIQKFFQFQRGDAAHFEGLSFFIIHFRESFCMPIRLKYRVPAEFMLSYRRNDSSGNRSFKKIYLFRIFCVSDLCFCQSSVIAEFFGQIRDSLYSNSFLKPLNQWPRQTI